MASVTLTKVWLHDADDLDDYVTVRARSIEVTPSRKVVHRVFAGGVVRAITTPARQTVASWEAVQVDKATLEWVEDRLGDTLMFRDPYGHLLFGTIAEVPVPVPLTNRPNVKLELRSLTHSVEV